MGFIGGRGESRPFPSRSGGRLADLPPPPRVCTWLLVWVSLGRCRCLARPGRPGISPGMCCPGCPQVSWGNWLPGVAPSRPSATLGRRFRGRIRPYRRLGMVQCSTGATHSRNMIVPGWPNFGPTLAELGAYVVELSRPILADSRPILAVSRPALAETISGQILPNPGADSGEIVVDSGQVWSIPARIWPIPAMWGRMWSTSSQIGPTSAELEIDSGPSLVEFGLRANFEESLSQGVGRIRPELADMGQSLADSGRCWSIHLAGVGRVVHLRSSLAQSQPSHAGFGPSV